MGFSCEDDDLVKVFQDDEEKQMRSLEVEEFNMRHHHLDHGVECETMEFWPVEHPEEPSDELDRPVKCPMPDDSSSVMNNGKMHEDEEPFKEMSSRMKFPPEQGGIRNNKSLMAAPTTIGAIMSPARQMRKRHHTLTRMDSTTLRPLIRIPPLPSPPTQNITIFEMLQHFDKFD